MALKISLRLIEIESYEEARILLKTIEVTINKELDLVVREQSSLEIFLTLFDWQQQQYMLKSRALVKGANKDLELFQVYWLKFVSSHIEDEKIWRRLHKLMTIFLQANLMCIEQKVVPLIVLKQMHSGSISGYAQQYIDAAIEYNTKCIFFDIPYDQTLLNEFFKDLNTLVTENEGNLIKFLPVDIDGLISMSMPFNILHSISEDTAIALEKINLIADDNISLNESEVQIGISKCRSSAFLNPQLHQPNIISLSPLNWRDGLESILRTIAWCDGSARRQFQENNIEGLNSIWAVIQQDIFENLKFSLLDRVNWKNAYALPEAVLPYVYKNMTLLILDIYPTYLEVLLSFIHERFSNQCGIYSEGFRGILNNVLEQVTKYELEDDVEDLAFSLLERWENFILLNLKNRHELVPELLTIIPLYERLNALEKAKNTYRHVLAFSMGPNWYKEDQLGLAVSTLEAIDIQTPLKNGVLSKIAGLLEVSSGEMTFERFVRYAKRDFIKTLCLRGEFDKAIRYYIRQTYGSLGQMYADITKGEIDRLSELAGTRFPGGALDEQDSILCIVRSAIPHLEWQFCWVLLEIFQFGDSRHLANYAEVYGNLLTANQGDIVAIEQMFSRLEIIYESELTNDERSNFISELKKHIPESLCDRFQNYFGSCIDISGSNKQESKKTSVVQTNAKENTGVKQDTFDSLFTPGIFGTSTSYSQVEAYFSSANKAIKRKNHKQAQQDILTALKALQLGQWPIWDALVPEMKRGQKLLKETTCSQEDLIKLFQPLIVNERYAQHWFIAENLISWLSPDASVDDQNKLLELSINHLQLMVGASEAEVADFGFLEESNQNDKILSFVKLIVHVIDHPTWLRSEKAAEMLLWLLRNKPEYIPLFGHLAFSNNPNNHAEVICGVLDHLSYSESKLWDFLSPSLDFATIIKDCKHIGRLSILKRILNQTAKNGNEYAIQLLDQLKSGINQVSVPLDHNILKYPKWAMGLKSEWSELEKLGVVNSSLIQQTTSILEALCSPLTLETVYEIESLLSEGYYANKEDPLRWRAKVSYALQTALQSTAPVNLHEKIVEIFRPYNPTRLDHLRIKDFKPHGKKWLISQPNAIFDRNVYLDYYESFWYEGDLREVRMTAYLGDIPQTPISSGRFSSTEIPTSNKALHIDICANVDPIHTYFGSFTPAIPTPHFMQISDIDPKSLKRAWWRSSRRDQEAAGAPESEGCYLSINEDEFLKLQNKMNIFWIVEIDSQPYGLISYQ